MCTVSQNQVIYLNLTSFSSPNTGSDVILNTNDSVIMPSGSCLPACSLPTDGSYLEIQLAGAMINNSTRDFKIQIGSTTNTIFSIPGVLTGGFYTCRVYLTRTSYNTIRWHSITNFNKTQVVLNAAGDFTADLTINQPIKFYINQSTSSSLVISEIKATKIIV